jgi:hypothetical protein
LNIKRSDLKAEARKPAAKQQYRLKTNRIDGF